MPTMTIELDEATTDWLAGIAEARGSTPEQAAAGELAAAARSAAGPNWRESDVLTCLRRMDGRPGRGVPVKSVLIHWQRLGGPRTSDDLFAGLDGLAARGWIEPFGPGSTAVVLTEHGFSAAP